MKLKLNLIANLVGSSAVAVTLMACYGLPPCDPDDDRDKDGAYPSYCDSIGGDTRFDCNDADPTIHQCADDPDGDGIDQNCDGEDGEAPPDVGTSSTSTTTNVCSQMQTAS
jgi:hypothetical protein